MPLAAEKELKHIGESCGCADHDHDLIHDLSKRLDALWRYDQYQYVANAEGKPELQNLWRDLKRQEVANVQRFKQLVDVAKETVASDTGVKVANILADGQKQAAEIGAQRDLEVAKIELQIAQLDAQRAQCVQNRVDHCRRGADGAGLADAFDAEWIGRTRDLLELGEPPDRNGVVGGHRRQVHGWTGTAQRLLGFRPDEATYLLARCPDPAAAEAAARHIREHPKLSAFTRAEFSRKTRWHWLLKTNAGTITLFTAVLALVVGMVISSQTLYGATVALLKEYASPGPP